MLLRYAQVVPLIPRSSLSGSGGALSRHPQEVIDLFLLDFLHERLDVFWSVFRRSRFERLFLSVLLILTNAPSDHSLFSSI